MSKRIITSMVLFCFIVAIAGCATLFKQKDAKVSFTSDPEGAMVYINGNKMGKTPLQLKLSHKKALTITFKKGGYEDKTYIVNTRVGAGWVILDCLGGFIPVVIDAVTGNWYSLEEEDIKVILDVR